MPEHFFSLRELEQKKREVEQKKREKGRGKKGRGRPLAENAEAQRKKGSSKRVTGTIFATAVRHGRRTV